MEIKISTQQMLNILYILSWIIFIGVCVEAGAFIFYAVLTMVLSPENAEHLWKQADLSALHAYDSGHFLVEMTLISIVAVLRAILFYVILKLLHNKKLDFSSPFSEEMRRFVSGLSYLALGIGLFSFGGANYTEWLITKGVKMPDLATLRIGGADVWLFMGIILLVIAQLFKRGTEMQTENELTI